MKVIAKKLFTGNKNGKDWTRTNLIVLTDSGKVHNIALFGVGDLPHIDADDEIEPIFELVTVTEGKFQTVFGKIVGVKAK